MYPLLPWKWIGTGLTVVVLLSVYSDDVAALIGINVTSSNLVQTVPVAVLVILGGFFGGIGYWAPWRILWRLMPSLNSWVFPDLNGVWVGSTKSNWPTIAKMLEAAQTYQATDKAELHAVPPQSDAIAVQIKASLFALKICAGLSSTDGQSHSVTARPRWEPNSGHIHITYVYNQSVPDPASTDQDSHMGAADVQIDPDDLTKVEGVYWTRRRWKQGLNTAGSLYLNRLIARKDPKKTLREYAADEKARLAKI